MSRYTPMYRRGEGWVSALSSLLAAVIFLLIGLGIYAWLDRGGDNAQIRALTDDVFEYTHMTYASRGGRYAPKMDRVTLHFTNRRTGDDMTWKGDADDAIRILEYVDAGECYRHPLDADTVQRVPCR